MNPRWQLGLPARTLAMAEGGVSLDGLLAACANLSDADVLELKLRMDTLAYERSVAEADAKAAEEKEFKRTQKAVLKGLASGKTDKMRARSEKVHLTPEEKAAREKEAFADQKRREAEQERLEAGDTGPKQTRAEQLEQQKLGQRKVKAGVRMMKTGPAKHKFVSSAGCPLPSTYPLQRNTPPPTRWHGRLVGERAQP